MKVKYFAWFEFKHEKTEFLQLLRNSRSEIEATNKVMSRYPELTLQQIRGVLENFKDEISKNVKS